MIDIPLVCNRRVRPVVCRNFSVKILLIGRFFYIILIAYFCDGGLKSNSGHLLEVGGIRHLSLVEAALAI